MRIFVKPNSPELKIYSPDTGRHLKTNGEAVEQSSYWIKHEQYGDVTISDVPAESVPPEAAAPESEAQH